MSAMFLEKAFKYRVKVIGFGTSYFKTTDFVDVMHKGCPFLITINLVQRFSPHLIVATHFRK